VNEVTDQTNPRADKKVPKLLTGLLAVIFPPRCAFCGGFCKEKQPDNICPACAKLVEELRPLPNAVTAQIADGLPQKSAAAVRYEGIGKKAMLGLKYSFRLYAAPQFARQMVLAAQKEEIPLPELIVPVPRYRSQRAAVSAPKLLTRQLSALIGVPAQMGLLVKKFPTPPQHQLSSAMRQGNLVGAFDVTDPSRLRDKTVWLVDDIFTTGATLRECSRILWLYGAKAVYGICFAFTPPRRKEKEAPSRRPTPEQAAEKTVGR